MAGADKQRCTCIGIMNAHVVSLDVQILSAIHRNASPEVLGPAVSGSATSLEDGLLATDILKGEAQSSPESWTGMVKAILHQNCAELGGYYGCCS